MDSLLSQGDDNEDVGLFFVTPLNLEQKDCNDDMKEAYQNSLDNQLEPVWKTEESCLLLNPTKRNVFVFQRFEGAGFDHLKQFKCVSITGPRCLNHCLLKAEQMPLVAYPTFTAAMRGLVITCSGGGVEVKNEIKDRVQLMAGTYSKGFTEKTTHVVVSSVSSSKYEKALELGIPVMTYQWVNAVWKRSLKEYVLAEDEIFNDYKCPPFLDLKVCCSGLNTRDTERIKNTVIKFGGTYDSSFCQKINVLVVKHAKGDKYKYAQVWKIPCVEPRWIDDSVKSGHALPTVPYEVTGGRAASSPNSDRLSSVSFSANVSSIPFDGRSHIDETLMNSTTSSVASFCPLAKVRTPVKLPPPGPQKTPIKTPVKGNVQQCPNPGEFKHLLRDLSLNQTKKAGPFLDGCGVYLLGWDPEEEESLRKILKCSGAARFTDLSDRVSHVLVGNLEKQFLRSLKSLPHKPYVVNIKWLIQSVAEKGPATEDPFSCLPSDNLNVSEAPSPLSKKGMAMLQREKFSPQKPLVMQNHTVKEEGSPHKGKQLLAKYMSGESFDKNALSTSTISMPPPPVPPSRPKLSHQGNISPRGNESDIATSQEDREMIFTGLNFLIVDVDAATYVENDLIQKYGGVVLPKTFKGISDYAIVPLTGATLRQTATEIITILWLECCIEQQAILPIEYYHQPVVLDVNKRPLDNCVLGLSGYSGKERQFILELAAALGATCQDVFAKRSKGNAKASSHLICKTTEKSEKLNAAIKWCRPAVYHSWLLACAAAGSLVPEDGHFVIPHQVVKPLENTNSTVCSVVDNSRLSNKCESAQVAALRKLPCFKTPERVPAAHDSAEVERALNYAPSVISPDVKTPPVPLGISENPTPGESKRMQKWLNRLPGQLPKSPPRRNSTPLHELRKRILETHTVTTPEMLHLVPIKDSGPCDEDIPESANALKIQNSKAKSDFDNGTEQCKISSNSCSTPTITVGNGVNASRKLFDNAEQDLGSPIDGQLDKLKKLIATPEVTEDSSTPKPSSRNHIRVVSNPDNQRMYDTLKDGSQPYAIKWEDPVNMKRSGKEDYDCQERSEDEEDKNPAKRKSSEGAENPPEVKKSHIESAPKYEVPAKIYKFALSHVDAKEPYLSIVRKLGGGQIVDTSSYNPEATHLLLAKSPQRSEKLLAFIASGKWILHVSYLIESEKQGKFLKEEDFEWGNPQNKLLSHLKPNSVEAALARASYRWRTAIAEKKCRGAFEGFRCKIYAADEKAVAFSRLIAAGGGIVLPLSSEEKPSFCLVNLTSHKAVLADYVKLDIPCLPVTFLYDHLTLEPIPRPEARALEEYNKLREKYLESEHHN